MTNGEHYLLVEILTGHPWEVRKRLKEFIDTAVITKDEPEEPLSK